MTLLSHTLLPFSLFLLLSTICLSLSIVPENSRGNLDNSNDDEEVQLDLQNRRSWIRDAHFTFIYNSVRYKTYTFYTYNDISFWNALFYSEEENVMKWFDRPCLERQIDSYLSRFTPGQILSADTMSNNRDHWLYDAKFEVVIDKEGEGYPNFRFPMNEGAMCKGGHKFYIQQETLSVIYEFDFDTKTIRMNSNTDGTSLPRVTNTNAYCKDGSVGPFACMIVKHHKIEKKGMYEIIFYDYEALELSK